jgi:hypothetical protein
MRSDRGEPVKFGEDSYYEEIIQKNSQGLGFSEQRDSWKEGTDLSFIAEFYALSVMKMMDEVDESVADIDDANADNVVDATAEIRDSPEA